MVGLVIETPLANHKVRPRVLALLHHLREVLLYGSWGGEGQVYAECAGLQREETQCEETQRKYNGNTTECNATHRDMTLRYVPAPAGGACRTLLWK